MAAALTARNLSMHFATKNLFAGVAISLEERERLALIGPNGSGKSTLLKILARILEPDEGEISLRKGVRAAYVAQQDVFPEGSTVLSAVTDELHACRRAGQLPFMHDDHEADLAAEMILGRLEFPDFSQKTASLSGGQRKRLSIARELAKEPDILLLDEPTNHLDVDGIEWLEGVLRQGPFASIFVTHDRMFLESVAMRVVELARHYPEGTFSVAGNYTEFLRRKEEFLDGQAKQEHALSGQVREDLRWLARGPQARRTKSKSRISASYERMDELAELRSRNAPQKAAGIEFDSTGRQTRKLIEARGISKSYGDRHLFHDVDVILSPGSVLGLLGPNGSGKSTLIKILTGEIESDPATAQMLKIAAEDTSRPPGTPLPGTIRRADKLRTVVFSQHRSELDPEMTLRDTLSPHADSVIYRDRTIHVVTWANKFLFTKEDLKTPVKALSGGEQARIHIARLMLEPADVLILDEPTNDLDIPSLEVLENSIEEFPGSVVLVTHDRAMLSDLSTQILALDGKGGTRYFTDYDQWTRRLKHEEEEKVKVAVAVQAKSKLSYKEQQELQKMPTTIATAEAEVARLEMMTSDPALLSNPIKLADVCKKVGDAQRKVERLYARFEELEAKKA